MTLSSTNSPSNGNAPTTEDGLLLQTRGVTKRFGGLVAVSKMDYTQEVGTIYSIIGPNGAGKTTFFNTLTGIYRPEQGEIIFDGHQLVGRRPDQVAGYKIARTFQNIRLFGNMTVIENIMVGMHIRLRQNPVGVLLRTKAFKEEEERSRTRAQELMEYVGLGEVGDELARNLPYGAQRRVEIARALASEPKLLLLDEPTAGMNPHETDEAIALFRRLRDELGITILLIEHDMRVVMGISERITVMDYGQKIAEGLPVEIRSNARVIEAYLGREAVTSLEEQQEE
jgi:branched-chain amino acid transport system ATP-binding protein